MAQTVLVDFDGTLHKYTNGWTGELVDPEPPMDGAEEFLHWLSAQGFDTIVCSTRAKTPVGTQAIWDYLGMWDLAHLVKEVTVEKRPAIAFVDDRGVTFSGDWQPVMEQVLALRNK